MKKLLFLYLVLLYTSATAYCQDLTWAVSGGSASSGSGQDESCIDMATDPNGNVYIISQVKDMMLNANGVPLTAYGETDVMLSSFRCDGTHRWSKVFGAPLHDFTMVLR
jgi:hypothetical protein